jgi:DNA-directed RNA polymerase specialized sigma24 family protein
MNDPQNPSMAGLVSALREGDAEAQSDALAVLFDAYADRLFRYCWFMLRNADLAQIALRDTLVVAQAHIGRLANSGYLDSWLYSLARVECRRRRPVPAGEADEPPARPNQPDADSRLMAWNAVTSMDTDAMEVLELAYRHEVDLGLVLGLPGNEARARLDAGRQDLERALGAEILVSRAGHACPDRAEVMRGWTGTVTPELREHVLRHAVDCRFCAPSLPRNVSGIRVYALLPVPSLPSGARERVLDFFADSRLSAYREFAVTRAAELGPGGFPVGSLSAQESTRPLGLDGAEARDDSLSYSRRRLAVPSAVSSRGRALAALGAATVAAVVTAAFVLGGQESQVRNPGQGPAASAGGGPVVPRRAGAGAEGAVPAGSPTTVTRSLSHTNAAASPSASELLFAKVTHPLPGPDRTNPPVSPPRLPGRPLPLPTPSSTAAQGPGPGTLEVSPGSLNLGTSSQSQLTITADGKAQAWSASTQSGQVTLGSPGGTLQPGQSVTLTVSIQRRNGSGGSGVIVIDQGSTVARTVQVSWTATTTGTGTGQPRPPRPPHPTPTPSPTPSSSPSPSPSPSPSTSSGSSPPASPSTSPTAAQSPTRTKKPAPPGRPHPHPHPTRSPRPSASPADSATLAGAGSRWSGEALT